ncbi:HK97 gp10 family phage protein [Methanococcoides sp. FTZ1]|uniref:HK97 gp10 family phage protein n=1 Tax=Methanococcoides sp. FTZ1 TaxID=3439061 RepID=UPI003F8374D6
MDEGVRVDISGAKEQFQKAGVNVHRAMPKLLKKLAGSGERFMKRNMPVDTGNMRASVSSDVFDEVGARITVSANYAQYVNDGTRPHIIRPKNAKCLAFAPFGARGSLSRGHRTAFFTFGGKTVETGLVCVKVVHHPGTKGSHFVEKTRDHILKIIPTESNKIIADALKDVNK